MVWARLGSEGDAIVQSIRKRQQSARMGGYCTKSTLISACGLQRSDGPAFNIK